jgi:hypothetical protein
MNISNNAHNILRGFKENHTFFHFIIDVDALEQSACQSSSIGRSNI